MNAHGNARAFGQPQRRLGVQVSKSSKWLIDVDYSHCTCTSTTAIAWVHHCNSLVDSLVDSLANWSTLVPSDSRLSTPFSSVAPKMSNSPMVPQPHSKVLTATLADYVGLVVHNPSYACLITAEVMVLLGYYLTYIAILSIIHDMGNGDAMLLSLLAILQSLPAFLLPLCGVVADM